MNEERFENYLKEFEPRKPRTLEVASPKWRRLAAAAAVLLICGWGTWQALHTNQRTQNLQEITMGSLDGIQTPWRTRAVLTNQALESSEGFNAALEEDTKTRFSVFGQRDGALQVLAKE